ncbi:MAG: M13 family metallopeptidase [Pseudonocardia sp.]
MGRRTVLATAVSVTLSAALTTALAVSCASPSLLSRSSAQKGSRPHTSGLDLAGMDRSVSPSDSLFEFANGGWLHATDIPPDRAEVGTFSDLRVHVEDQLHGVVDDNQASPDSDTARKMGDLYLSCTDVARRDQLKATPLDPDFAVIDRLATPDDLVRYLGALQRTDFSDPIELGVRPDNRNSAVNITVAGQGNLTLPDRDYYLAADPMNVGVRDSYRAYAAKMLTLAGRPGADADAAAALDLETRLARIQQGTAANRDPLAAYNKLNVADAQARTGLDWKGYLTAYGMAEVKELVIAQPSYFSGFSELVRTVPMPAWKGYLRWHLLSDFAPYLSSEFVDTQFEFTNKVLGGPERNRELWRRGVACVNAGMGEALGELYTKQYFPADAKKRVDRLITNVVAAFRTSIDTLDWMSPATKAEARDKLAKLTVKTGYPYWYRDWSLLEVGRDDLIGNLRRASDLEARRDVTKLNQPAKTGEWDDHVTPQTVNAVYNASRNEITFPAAILQPPFFDVNADDAVNYGALGAVIGHEISHAFDDAGRQYDGAGNLRDWWTPADATAFGAKTNALVNRFNGFVPLPETHLDGKLTLGENLADLSGLSVAFKAYQAQLAAPAESGGGPSPVLDGFTGPQRFFLGYARLWRVKQRDPALRQSLRTDTHSPGRFRADGVANNLDDFYPTWDVKPGSPSYLTPAQRIRIW